MARTPADVRARRLIALIGLLEPGAELSLTSLAEQLGATPAELAADIETLSMCGVAPYDPLALVPVSLDGDTIEVFGEVPAVHGGVRLSPNEASALVHALQAAGFTTDDPLPAKLLEAAASSFDAGDVESVVRSAIGGHDVSVYEQLARAAQEGDVVEVEYESSGAGVATCRTLEPHALFAERGAWYLVAWCRSAGAWRTFRIDRMQSVAPTGERFDEPRPGAPETLTAFDPAGLPSARLAFSTASDYSAREWPGSTVAGEGLSGGVLVDVPYAGTGWVARRVVARLGSVTVESPEEVRSAVAELASRLHAELG